MTEQADEVVEWLYELAKSGEWKLVLSGCEKMPKTAARCSRYRRPSSGWTFLHQAAYFGHEDAARMLIRLGASLAASSKENQTPSQVAERRGHVGLARLLKTAADGAESVWEPSPDADLLPSSSAWSEAAEKTALREMRVSYGGGVVVIAKGSRYFVDSLDRILVGWHGSYDPPCGMDGEPMVTGNR